MGFANGALPRKPVQTAANETRVGGIEAQTFCPVDLIFPDNFLLDSYGAAKKCAEFLTRSTNLPHVVESQTENIGDGFPAVVSQTYYRVVEK